MYLLLMLFFFTKKKIKKKKGGRKRTVAVLNFDRTLDPNENQVVAKVSMRRPRPRPKLKAAVCLIGTLASQVCVSVAIEQTSDIYGQLVDKSTQDNVQGLLSECYSGINMTTCVYNEDEGTDSSDLSGVFSDFPWTSTFTGDSSYCLTCCNNRRLDFSSDLYFPLECDMSNPLATKNSDAMDLIKLNETTWEFRFARRSTVDDRTIVRCDLNRTDLSLMMTGYELTIYAEEHDNVVAYWRGVTSCEAIAIEVAASETTKIFQEKITIKVNSVAAMKRPLLLVSSLLIAFWGRGISHFDF